MIRLNAIRLRAWNPGTLRKFEPARHGIGRASEQIRRPSNVKCGGERQEIRVGDAPRLSLTGD